MKIIHRDPTTLILQGDSSAWDYMEPVDFILTTPQAPLPKKLLDVPMIAHLGYHHRPADQRRRMLAEWMHGRDIGSPFATWNEFREDFFGFNLAYRPYFEANDIKPTREGWFPEVLVERIFDAYPLKPGSVVWDGFMGRGTVGKVARQRGYHYVGIEQSEATVNAALSYLGL